MTTRSKKYWRIEIEERQQIVFRRRLPGSLSQIEIATILQRLVCRKLSPDEILNSSLRNPKKVSLLAPHFDRHAKRPVIWLEHFPHYVASRWGADEIPDEPEISVLT